MKKKKKTKTKSTASQDRVLPYEGMFLFSQSQVAALQDAVDHLEEILRRAEAEIIRKANSPLS